MSNAIKEPLPSIIELGRALSIIDAEHWRLIESETAQDATDVKKTLSDQTEALRKLICTMPAATLMDAAVQIEVAYQAASDLSNNEWTDPRAQPELETHHQNLHRILISILPIVAAAAGLDLAVMGWEDVKRMHRIHFGEGMPA